MRRAGPWHSLVVLVVGLALAAVIAPPPAQAQSAVTPAASVIVWQPLGEPGSGGWLTSFIVSPHDPKRCLMGGDMLGIGWSEDRGDSWHPALGLPTYEICDFSWHPNQPNTVWVGTFAGPCLSADGGKTWTLKRQGLPPISSGTYSEIIEKVLFDPNRPERLMAVGGNSRQWRDDGKTCGLGAIYESMDAGESWKLLTRLTAEGKPAGPGQGGANILSAAFAAGSSGTLYATLAHSGVVVSTDGGKTWSPRNTGLPHLNPYRLFSHPTQPDTLWVSLDNCQPGPNQVRLPGGVYKSTDAGRSWTSISTGLFQHAAKEHQFTANYKGFCVSSKNPDVMVASNNVWDRNGIFLSADGGRQWRYVAGKQNVGIADHPALAPAARLDTAYPAGPALTMLHVDPTDEKVIYGLGAEYAVRSTDGGKSWVDLTARRPDPRRPDAWRGRGYSGLCCSTFRFHPTNPQRAILIALDAGKLWETLDGGGSWTRRGQEAWPWGGGADGCYAGDYGYVTTGQFGDWLGILRTTDGGLTWGVLLGDKHGLPERGKGGPPGGIYARPDNPKQVWAVVGGQLYHSADGGEQWRMLATGPRLRWIVGDPNRPGRMYLNGADGVFVCEDGQTLKPIGGPRPAERGRMACDADGRLYVCHFRQDAAMAGLWRYAEGQWERLLDEFYAQDIAVDPSNPQRLALVTNQDPYHDVCPATGVWTSSDGGRTWAQANAGLAMRRATCITFKPTDPEVLVCGTWGGGYYLGCWPKTATIAGTRQYRGTEQDRQRVAAPANAAPATAPTAGATGNAAPLVRVVIKNGGMTQGLALPGEWRGKYGECIVTRDTTTFKETPASLGVAVAGGKSGQAFQRLEGLAGKRIRLAGWIKSAGSVKAQVAVQSFAEGFKGNQFEQLKFVQGDTDWASFEKEIAVPEWAAWCHVLLLVEGEGKAWLDEVRDAAGAVDPGTPVREQDEWTAGPPPQGKPREPGWGFYPQFPTAWQSMHQGFVERTKKGNIDLVFLGDSITQGWTDPSGGRAVWEQRYAPLHAVDYGMGGNSTRQVLWQIQHGELDGLKPKVIVLMIGTNNLYSDHNGGTDEEIAQGIGTVVSAVRAKLPET